MSKNAYTQQHIVTVSSLDVDIEIHSDIPDTCVHLDNNNLLSVLIPNARVTHGESQNPTYTILHKQSKIQKASNNDYHIQINDDWVTGIPGYVVFFLHKLFDNAYQKKGMLSFHSSAISLENGGVLFLGPPGSGKTTVALSSTFNNVARFLSNNRTVVKLNPSPAIVAGTRGISLRMQDLMWFNRMYGIPAAESFAEKSAMYNPEIIIGASQLGISDLFKETALRRICLIQISQGVEEKILIDPVTSTFKLFENTSKTAWGECLLFDGKSISPVQEKETDSQKRLDMVNELARNIEILHLRGSVNYILSEATQGLRRYELS